jgi:hypothetical protein
MTNFRVDAIVRADDGKIKVLTAHHFEAKNGADAEREADEWAKVTPLVEADRLRIVRADMVMAQRLIGATPGESHLEFFGRLGRVLQF